MTIERIKNNVAYFCDLDGCLESLETEHKDFPSANAEAKVRGWVFRNRDGEWKHFCSKHHEEMDFRGQSIVTTRSRR